MDCFGQNPRNEAKEKQYKYYRDSLTFPSLRTECEAIQQNNTINVHYTYIRIKKLVLLRPNKPIFISWVILKHKTVFTITIKTGRRPKNEDCHGKNLC
jgi:hypothetical protein